MHDFVNSGIDFKMKNQGTFSSYFAVLFLKRKITLYSLMSRNYPTRMAKRPRTSTIRLLNFIVF